MVKNLKKQTKINKLKISATHTKIVCVDENIFPKIF